MHRLNTSLLSLSILLSFSVLFTSCMKDELPVEAHDSGDVLVNAVEMGSDYRYQIYYDLETNMEVSRNVKNIWDLGLEASEDGYHIILNGAKLMQVYHTGKTDFSEVNETPNDGWKVDQPSGDLDETAIGEWAYPLGSEMISNQEVLVIDRGYGYENDLQGFRKIQVLAVNADRYLLRYAELDGSNENVINIEKDELYNFVFFSFEDNGKIVNVEPPKEQWDLLFSQYTFIFYDIPEASGIPQVELTDTLVYIVNGVLHNPNNTWATEDTLIGFEDFTFDDIDNLNFNPSLSTIGYEWKQYDFDTGIFNVFPEKNYIVKDEQDLFYKIHFIDFYNEMGEKGTPTFEYQAL